MYELLVYWIIHEDYIRLKVLFIKNWQVIKKMNVKPKMFPFLAVIHRHVRNPSKNLGLNSLKVTQQVNS